MQSFVAKAMIVGGMSVLMGLDALAAPTAVARYRDWTVFQEDVNGTRVCFAATEASDKAPRAARHGEVWFYVTNWANGSAKGQPSLKVGYELRSDLPGQLRVGGRTWRMFSHTNEAFAEDADDAAIVSALRRGRELRVEATSERNTKVAYHFSLSGSADAIDKAAEVCR